jgi:hypothetical protein
LFVNGMDPYKQRQDVTEKMLLKVLEAQLHNSDICDSKTVISEESGRRSVCPTAKDRKTDWKCCQCSEWVCKGHCIKTVQITCDNCKAQS